MDVLFVEILEMPDDASIDEAVDRAVEHFRKVHPLPLEITCSADLMRSHTHPRQVLMRATCEVANA